MVRLTWRRNRLGVANPLAHRDSPLEYPARVGLSLTDGTGDCWRPPSSSGLGYRLFMPATGVRVPLGVVGNRLFAGEKRP